MVTTVLYADTPEEMKYALGNELRRRAATLRGQGHNKTEKAKNDRAAFELESEADWLDRVEFKPRAEYPFKK
jgi:predicted amidophosphoribosyltransferase